MKFIILITNALCVQSKLYQNQHQKNNNQEKNGDVKEELPKGNDEKSEKGVADLPDPLSSKSDNKKSKSKPESPQEQTADN